VLSLGETLVSAIDLAPGGHELWAADTDGGLTHVDFRAPASRAHWYGLSDQKISCVSVIPAAPHLLLTASNNKSMKCVRAAGRYRPGLTDSDRIWDARNIRTLAGDAGDDAIASLSSDSPKRRSARKDAAPADSALPVEHDQDEVNAFLDSKAGKDGMRGDWRHGRAVGAAYWDARGRSVVSTCYDDIVRRECLLSV
jgi:hypothetical protein